jgi:membrane-associated phospholipid phosphatase
VTPSRPDRSRGLFVLAAIAATAYVVLAVLVAAHATQDLDVAARNHFRPHDVWGTTQMRVDVVVEGLKPSKMLPLLALVAVVACVRSRSWRPAAYAALLAGVTGVLTMVTKVIVGRPDPHQDMTAVGGSFPSGHTVTVLICLGGAILLLQERPRWWEWAVVGLVGVAMGLSLLLQAAHWFTDVLGGLLLGLAVLAAAVGLRVRGTDLPLRGGGPRAHALVGTSGRAADEAPNSSPESRRN